MNLKRLTPALLLTLAVTSTAFADSVWVKAEVADLRSGSNAVYGSVAQVKKGQELTVVSRNGKWIQVQVAGGASGWINEASVDTKKVGAALQILQPGAAAAGMSTGIAARGLQPDAEAYTQSHRWSKAPLESLIALRKSIQPQEYIAFTTQHKVGAK